MKIEILRPVRVNGDSCVRGDVVDANEKDAKMLINIGKAAPTTRQPVLNAMATAASEAASKGKKEK